uniref:DM domain-containing protein n=1 Tax=Elaeophora elaphi TaxID=1147741 RepID=A0A0R3RXF1_9BILA
MAKSEKKFETINAIAALSAAAAAVDKIGSKRVYYCQRCLNHNRLEPRKNHKCECVYANCACNKCILVEKRRVLNTQLHELEDVADVENEVGVNDHCGLAARSKGVTDSLVLRIRTLHSSVMLLPVDNVSDADLITVSVAVHANVLIDQLFLL